MNVYGINRYYCFNVLGNGKESRGTIKYCELDFIFEGEYENEFGDSDIFGLYIGYTCILFLVSSKKAKWFNGFNDYHMWVEQDLEAPISVKGELCIDYELENIDERYAEQWPTYYDKNQNILCMGDLNVNDNDEAVEFCTDIIAVLEDGKYLKAIWIRNMEFEGGRPF